MEKDVCPDSISWHGWHKSRISGCRAKCDRVVKIRRVVGVQVVKDLRRNSVRDPTFDFVIPSLFNLKYGNLYVCLDSTLYTQTRDSEFQYVS